MWIPGVAQLGKGAGPGFAAKGAGDGRGAGGAGAPFAGNPTDMDWICKMCRERNFARRADCFKCRIGRQPDAELVQAPSMSAPPNGTTLTGMVKSYNKKGFGFIMVFGHNSPDVFYTRENVSQRLMHPDMPGEQVTFELFRERGKLVARNIRPLGDALGGVSKGGNKGMIGVRAAINSQSSLDDGQWQCPFCSEHNFARRLECFKCKILKPQGNPMGGFSDAPTTIRPPAPRKTFSPHSGARAIRDSMREQLAAANGGGGSAGSAGGKSASSSSSSGGKAAPTKRKRSSSSSSSSSKKKDKKKKGQKKRSRSSSSKRSSSSSGIEVKDGATPAASVCPEIDKAKADALVQLTRLQSVEPKDARIKEYRSLLREWHPDKNPDRVELATAVFQFLQKGKALVNM